MLTITIDRWATVASQALASVMRRGWRGDVAIGLAGVFTSLGFAPFNRFYLPVITLAFLYWQWHDASPRLAMRRGWLFGIGLFTASVSWVYVAMDEFGHMGSSAGALTVLFVAVLSLYTALTGWVVKRFCASDQPAAFLLAGAAGWTLVEWVRGWLFTGFPWLLMGYSQLPSPMAGYAPVLGVYGISWLTVLVAIIVMFAGRHGQWIRQPKAVLAGLVFSMAISVWTLVLLQNQPQWFFNKFLFLIDLTLTGSPAIQPLLHGLLQLLVWAIVLPCLFFLNYLVFVFAMGWLEACFQRRALAMQLGLPAIFLLGALLQWVPWTQASSEAMPVSLLQGNIPQDIKWERGQQQKTLALYARMTTQRLGDAIIVMPENALPVYKNYLEANYLKTLAARAKAKGSALVVGLPVRNEKTGAYYNAMVAYGLGSGTYLKHHLVPFGEFIPFKDSLGDVLRILDVPMSDFSAGAARQEHLQVQGHPVAVTICYEDVFPAEVIRYLPKAEMLINASNNAWYGDSLAPHQHLQIAQMRALETGRYVLRATTNGISAIIDYQGHLTARSGQFNQEIITGEAFMRVGATPFVFYGNSAVLLLILISLIWVNRARLQSWVPGSHIAKR